MKFAPTALAGAFVIELETSSDERGFFARSFCRDEFSARGLDPEVAQCNISLSRAAGTLRGMHYQSAPRAEAKLVRCTAGAIYDVIVDLRGGSPTYRRWFGVELSAANRRMLYAPEGIAHGFQTLADDTEVHYQMSQPYDPAAARGIRWDDPAIGIVWPPAPRRTISRRDLAFALLE